MLWCTHFVFYKEYLVENLGNNMNIVDGNNGTVRHLQDVLRLKNELTDKQEKGNVMLFNSYPKDEYINLSKQLFNL